MKQSLVFVSSALLLAACSQAPAPVANKGYNAYDDNGVDVVQSFAPDAQKAAPVKSGEITSKDLGTLAPAAGGNSEPAMPLPPVAASSGTVAAPVSVAANDLPLMTPTPTAPVTPAPALAAAAPVATAPATLVPAYQAPVVAYAVPVTPNCAPQTAFAAPYTAVPMAAVPTYPVAAAAPAPASTLGAIAPAAGGTTAVAAAAKPAEPEKPKIASNLTSPPANARIEEKQGFIWPVHGEVLTQYGDQPSGDFNDGINIAASAGTPISAVANGEVVYAGSELKSYGNMIIIRHRDGVMTAYAHIDRIMVRKGDFVKQGDSIGLVGQTGDVSEPQLHFSVRRNKNAVNPQDYLG